MDVLVGAPANLRVDFESPSGTLIPDANSVAYQLYATDGTPLGGSTAVTTGANDTGVNISIAGSNQTITTPRRFEKRILVVSWTTGGQGYSARRQYRVVPFLNMTASPKDVRGVIGVNDDELLDEEIDLVEAYFLIETDVGIMTAQPGQNPATVGPTNFATALATGTRVELLANEAIVGQAVMKVIEAMSQQIAMTQRDGVMVFQRFANVDWPSVKQRAADMRSRGLAAIVGLPESNETLMMSIRGCDPVTYWRGVTSWP